LSKASDWSYEKYIEIDNLEGICDIFKKYDSYGGFVINIINDDLVDVVIYDLG
jgi:hypothetical protein